MTHVKRNFYMEQVIKLTSGELVSLKKILESELATEQINSIEITQTLTNGVYRDTVLMLTLPDKKVKYVIRDLEGV